MQTLGIWLLDLKHQHPDKNWELQGVDIGSSLFPQKTSWLDLRAFPFELGLARIPFYTPSTSPDLGPCRIRLARGASQPA